MVKLVIDDKKVSAYIANAIGCPEGFGPGHSIGSVDDKGNPLGGFYYEANNGQNCFAHAAGEHGSRWLTRQLMLLAVLYPFKQLGVERITAWVEASNIASRRLVEHIGFTEETRLAGAARDGGNVIIYVLWRKDCRFLEADYVKRCGNTLRAAA